MTSFSNYNVQCIFVYNVQVIHMKKIGDKTIIIFFSPIFFINMTWAL